jgi:hypothetical protein
MKPATTARVRLAPLLLSGASTVVKFTLVAAPFAWQRE